MVGGRVLDDETLITLDTLELVGLLNGPFTNVGPLLLLLLLRAGQVLLGVGGLPSLLPVVGELLEEVGLDSGGLGDDTLVVNGSSHACVAG